VTNQGLELYKLMAHGWKLSDVEPTRLIIPLRLMKNVVSLELIYSIVTDNLYF
jgi:hypothetical protein